MKHIILGTVIALTGFVLEQRAQACSVAAGPLEVGLPPRDGMTLGPSPLFLSHAGSGPHVTRDGDDVAVAMVHLADFDAVAWRATGGATVRAWRPAQPLAPGQYHVGGVLAPDGKAISTFFVDPDYRDALPTLERAAFHITLDDPDEDDDTGCGSDSSCDDIDFTALALEFSAPEVVAGALVELSFPQREVSSTRFVGGTRGAQVDVDNPESLRRDLVFLDAYAGLAASFKVFRVCVALTPVTEYGTLGQRVDLGCARPDGDDPRVEDTRGRAAGHTSDPWLIALALMLLTLRRRRPVPYA